MKTYAALLLCVPVSVSLVGCDTAAPDSTTSAPTAAAGKADGIAPAPDEVVFSRDDRPVDGLLRELRIEPNEHGSYDVSMHRAWFDRIAGQHVEETEVVAQGLDCSFDFAAAVICGRDNRPVDGALVEVEVLHDGQDWDATLRTAYSDRIAGVDIDETELLAVGLELDGYEESPPATVFERDARPVDGALTQVIVEPADLGYELSVRTAFIDRIAGVEVDETETLAVGLECEFDKVVFCFRDDLPVDGSLKELLIAPGALGGHDATFTETWFDRIEGEWVTQSETLGTRLSPG